MRIRGETTRAGRCRWVHRDICPHNVLINTEGQPKITDFGIALAANRATTLDDGAVCGKGPYMSPEQAAVREVDFRTDIFALGTVLFQLLSRHARAPGDDDDAGDCDGPGYGDRLGCIAG